MPDISFVNPQINNITNQEISIQVSLNGFSFSISSSENNDCLAFRHYSFKNLVLIDELIRNTEHIVSEDNYLNTKYNKANIFYVSQNVTIIPGDYFDKNNLKTYFEFNHNLAELDEIHYSYIQEINAYNVYSIPNYLTNSFYNLSPSIKFEHQTNQMIRFGYKNLENSRTIILLGINKGFFDLVIYEGQKLILSNSFQYANTMDFIYFFLYAIEQLKIDISSAKIFTLGNDLHERKFIDEIEQKIGNTAIPAFNLKGICQNLSEVQAAKFYTLFL
jgi:hypothetical protein